MSGRDPIPKENNEEKQIEKKPKFVVMEVPTQMDYIITNKNNKKGEENYNLLTAVCKIMNDIEELKEKIK